MAQLGFGVERQPVQARAGRLKVVVEDRQDKGGNLGDELHEFYEVGRFRHIREIRGRRFFATDYVDKFAIEVFVKFV